MDSIPKSFILNTKRQWTLAYTHISLASKDNSSSGEKAPFLPTGLFLCPLPNFIAWWCHHCTHGQLTGQAFWQRGQHRRWLTALRGVLLFRTWSVDSHAFCRWWNRLKMAQMAMRWFWCHRARGRRRRGMVQWCLIWCSKFSILFLAWAIFISYTHR